MDDVDRLKQAHRYTWEAGDYGAFAERVTEMSSRLVERVGVTTGSAVLDVACGLGNTALAAARRGADVVGLDLTAKLIEEARTRAAAAGLDVRWIEGDAESLPFEDGRFDFVLSTFGVMLAPRHEVAAAELVRVCRPGGIIGTCNPTPDGWAGRFIALMASYLPPQPSAASAPWLWGTEAHLERLLGSAGVDLTFERQTVVLEFASVEDGVRFFETNFGPLDMTRRKLTLRGRWDALRSEVAALMASFNQAEDRLRLPLDYLMAVGRTLDPNGTAGQGRSAGGSR